MIDAMVVAHNGKYYEAVVLSDDRPPNCCDDCAFEHKHGACGRRGKYNPCYHMSRGPSGDINRHVNFREVTMDE